MTRFISCFHFARLHSHLHSHCHWQPRWCIYLVCHPQPHHWCAILFTVIADNLAVIA